MPYQVQNHEPPAGTASVPDHLDKLLIAQVVRQAYAHGHVGRRQGVPHGVKLQNPKVGKDQENRGSSEKAQLLSPNPYPFLSRYLK